jgi:hypothetical protein
MPVKLSDSETSLLLSLSAPIAQERRPEFLRAVVTELEAQQAIGEGVVHRVARTVQRAYFSPPHFGEGRR